MRTKTGFQIEAQMRRLHMMLFLDYPERWEKMMDTYFRYMRNLRYFYGDDSKFSYMAVEAPMGIYAAAETLDLYESLQHGTELL